MPRWVLLLTVASTVVIAIVVGVLWYVIGGWPRDHDRYGSIAIPGKRTLVLPKGEVRFSFEGQVTGGGQTRTIEDPPEGLRVRVSRRGRRLRVEEVSSSLYGIASGDRGHEPLAKADVPERARYRVRARADSASGGGKVTVGPALWNPLDSRLVGAVGIGFAALLVLMFFELPLLFMGRLRSG